MKRALAVIGASYGDEGKGLMVDYLCASTASCGTVVRFNGGAQAGHTVQVDGRRHVFHHFGSGTFAGWRTHLGPEFICNPLLFVPEGRALGWAADVSASPVCRVTTHHDMLINQAAEERRGAARHGSCGVGINETVQRCDGDIFLKAWQLTDERLMLLRLARIRDEWVPFRLKALGLPPDALSRHSEAEMTDAFVDAARIFRSEVSIVNSRDRLRREPHIIFEGAQGLALDRGNVDDFPFLTNSHTGLRNVSYMARAADVEELDACYVTRAYATRHGPGPLPGEEAGPPYPGTEDATNLPNPHQGTLRFAPLSPFDVERRIREDLRHVRRARRLIAVTCTDQVRGDFRYLDLKGNPRAVSNSGPADVADLVAKMAGADGASFWSDGPTRAAVHATAILETSTAP